VTSLEGDNFILFYYLIAFEILPDKRGGLNRAGLLHQLNVYVIFTNIYEQTITNKIICNHNDFPFTKQMVSMLLWGIGRPLCHCQNKNSTGNQSLLFWYLSWFEIDFQVHLHPNPFLFNGYLIFILSKKNLKSNLRLKQPEKGMFNLKCKLPFNHRKSQSKYKLRTVLAH